MQKTNKEWLDFFQSNGFSFFNTNALEKKVLTKWSEYQHRLPTQQEISSWITKTTQNYAVVCGEISNIVVFDIDTKNGGDPAPFLNKGMYEVKTPSGGYHFYCKYDNTFDSTLHSKTAKLKGVDIQTNGSLIFLPICRFPSKGGYEVVNDVPIAEIPTEVMQYVLEALKPEKEVDEIKPYKPQSYHLTGDAKPGDIFNALATWSEILIPLGWKPLGHIKENGVQYWRRPGKNEGISASTNWGGHDLLIPFTTSTDLDARKGYTKFKALTFLKYNGDYHACAKGLILDNINNQIRKNYNG